MANQLEEKVVKEEDVSREQKNFAVVESTQHKIDATMEKTEVKTEEQEDKDKKVEVPPDIITTSVTKSESGPGIIEQDSLKKNVPEVISESVKKEEDSKNNTIEVEDDCITEVPQDPKDFDVIDLCEDDDEDDGLDKDSALQLLYTKNFTEKKDLLKSIYRSPKPKQKPAAPIFVNSYNRTVGFVPLNLPNDPFIYLGGGRRSLQNIQVTTNSSPYSSSSSTPGLDEENLGDPHNTSVEIIEEAGSSPANRGRNGTPPLFEEDRKGNPDIEMMEPPVRGWKQRKRARKNGDMLKNTEDVPLFIEFDSKSYKDAKLRKKRKKFTKSKNKEAIPKEQSSNTAMLNVPSVNSGAATEETGQLSKKKKKKDLDAPSAAPADNIACLQGKEHQSGGLRPIAIDGPSISVGHGQGKAFSCVGLKLCIEYFQNRGHNVKAFLPRWRMRIDNQNMQIPTTNGHLLKKMDDDNLLVLTPSKSYDDRYVVQYAAQTGAVIVSFDAYLDIKNEHPEWLEAVDKRRLVPTWADDILMFPKDPLGRKGPTLKEFLRFPVKTTEVVEIS